MINELLLNILKWKIEKNEVIIEEIKDKEYKSAIEDWLITANN